MGGAELSVRQDLEAADGVRSLLRQQQQQLDGDSSSHLHHARQSSNDSSTSRGGGGGDSFLEQQMAKLLARKSQEEAAGSCSSLMMKRSKSGDIPRPDSLSLVRSVSGELRSFFSLMGAEIILVFVRGLNIGKYQLMSLGRNH
jgi:hypothetical protein